MLLLRGPSAPVPVTRATCCAKHPDYQADSMDLARVLGPIINGALLWPASLQPLLQWVLKAAHHDEPSQDDVVVCGRVFRPLNMLGEGG